MPCLEVRTLTNENGRYMIKLNDNAITDDKHDDANSTFYDKHDVNYIIDKKYDDAHSTFYDKHDAHSTFKESL